MKRLIGVVLVLGGIAVAVLFFLSGAGLVPAEPAPLVQQLQQTGLPLVGTPWLAVVAGALFFLGVLIVAPTGKAEDPYPVREVVLVLSAAASFVFSAAIVLGVTRVWKEATLGALAIGGGAEALLSLGLAIRLAVASEKRKLLFVPGLLAAVLLFLFYLVLLMFGL